AAGLGTPLGKNSAEKTGTSRKQFMLLDGSPILMHTGRQVLGSHPRSLLVGAGRAQDLERGTQIGGRGFPTYRVAVGQGGDSRQQSVEHALRAIGPEADLVAVHDAVRPFIDLETMHHVFDEAAETGAAIVGVPAVDTIKQVTRGTSHVRVRATL